VPGHLPATPLVPKRAGAVVTAPPSAGIAGSCTGGQMLGFPQALAIDFRKQMQIARFPFSSICMHTLF